MAQHVDRKSIYTDLEARIKYLHDFLDFGEADINALAFGSRFVQDLIPAIVHIVYTKLLQFDITARAFVYRDTRSEDPIPADNNLLDENGPELLERKSFLISYLKKICSDPSKMAFWEYLDQVGAMHVGLRRNRPLQVEYIHIGATLSLIQAVFFEAILTHNVLPMSKRVAMVKALSKVIWIQNDLFARWHVRDGEEFHQDANGKLPEVGTTDRMASHSGDTSEAEDDHLVILADEDHPKSPPAKGKDGVCPFASMSQQMKKLNVES